MYPNNIVSSTDITSNPASFGLTAGEAIQSLDSLLPSVEWLDNSEFEKKLVEEVSATLDVSVSKIEKREVSPVHHIPIVSPPSFTDESQLYPARDFMLSRYQRLEETSSYLSRQNSSLKRELTQLKTEKDIWLLQTRQLEKTLHNLVEQNARLQREIVAFRTKEQPDKPEKKKNKSKNPNIMYSDLQKKLAQSANKMHLLENENAMLKEQIRRNQIQLAHLQQGVQKRSEPPSSKAAGSSASVCSSCDRTEHLEKELALYRNQLYSLGQQLDMALKFLTESCSVEQ